MKRRNLLILLILLVAMCFVYAGELEDFRNAMPVVVDCLSSVFVTEYSDYDIELPCTSVSFEDGLPKRISFFLADPSDYIGVIEKYAVGQGGVLSSILSILNKTASDPFITAVYISMASKKPTQNAYLLSGSVSVSYPEGTTIGEIAAIWLDRKFVDGDINLVFDLGLYGNLVKVPLYITGSARIFIDSDNQIVLETGKDFIVNGIPVEKVSFYF